MFGHKKEEKKHRLLPLIGGLFFLAVLGFVLALWGPTVYANLITRGERYELSRVKVQDVPKRDAAIVLGAALRNKGTEPSSYLQWRINTAVQLYKAGKVDRLLMSGDGSYYDHDEPYIMRREAIRQGVPADKIDMDKFGFDTYDSCTRAMKIRGITSATLVTQGYHLPRAVFTCQAIGMDAIGVNAQSSPGRNWTPYGIAREWLSTDKLFVQLVRHDMSGSVRWQGQ